jgi:hypothetical protein
MSETMSLLLEPAGAIRWKVEARKARRRFYPATFVYTAYSVSVLALAARPGRRGVVATSFLAGVAAWTLLEYLVHRFILHGRFPDGSGFYRRFTNKYFDPLHIEHHKRPWDGNHISGQLHDTLHFAALFVGISCLFPLHIGPVVVAGLLQAYVVEEWVHQSVHFYNFKNPYFRYIRRHHMFHHSPKGQELGYGLTSGIWDVVWGTRFPAAERRALYGRQKAATVTDAERWWRRARRALSRTERAA